MDLNKAMIIGRLTRDPELRSTASGQSVCSFGLATNYVYTNQQSGQKVEQVEFHNIVMWGKLAEIASQYLKKGRRAYIEGRLQTRKWQTQAGEQRQTTEIVADNMIMLDSGQGGGATSTQPAGNPSQGGGYSSGVPKTPAPNVSSSQEEELPTINQDEDINVEDIPF